MKDKGGKNMATIYKIINNITNKIYIGETTRTLSVRWRQHKSRSKDINNNTYLYLSMRKYGIENFSVEILEECEDSKRFERETYYIKTLNSMAPNGYNLVLSQNGTTSLYDDVILELWNEGLLLVEIGKQINFDPKIVSRILLNLGITKEEIQKRKGEAIGKRSSKGVTQYSLEGEYLGDWESATAAAETLGLNRASISKCCNGDMLTYKNYIWQYTDIDDIDNRILLVNSKPKVGTNSKPILCYDQKHNLIKEYPSASAAGREFGVAHAGIAYAARTGGTSLGYYCEYKS